MIGMPLLIIYHFIIYHFECDDSAHPSNFQPLTSNL